MTDHSFVPFEELPARRRRQLLFRTFARTIATITIVVAVYFGIPMDRAMTTRTVVGLVIGGLALVAIVAWQVRQIMRSEHPGVRAVEALAFIVPVYVLIFAATYFLMDHAQAAAFGAHLSRVDAMYFSATVFTTVGFGNVAVSSQAARVVVTVQMMLDLVIIGIVVRGVLTAVKTGRERPASVGLPARGAEPSEIAALDS
jgi:preprotein translocase subunit YajC